MTLHEHTFRRSGYTGDGAEGFTIIDCCTVCRAERRWPATEEEAAGIRQEWADRDELHAVFHAFCKATDGLDGFELRVSTRKWCFEFQKFEEGSATTGEPVLPGEVFP